MQNHFLLAQEEISCLLAPEKQQGLNLILHPTVNFEHCSEITNKFSGMAKHLQLSIEETNHYSMDITLNSMRVDNLDNYSLSLNSLSLFSISDNSDTFIRLPEKSVEFIVSQTMGGSPAITEKGSFTSIELDIVKKFTNSIWETISETLSLRLREKSMETSEKLIITNNREILIVTLNIGAGKYNQPIELIFPHAVFSSFKNSDKTANKTSAHKLQLSKHALNTESELLIILKKLSVKTGDIIKWKKGDFLPMAILKNDEISIYCDDKEIFKGIMGRKDDRIVIKISKRTINNE